MNSLNILSCHKHHKNTILKIDTTRWSQHKGKHNEQHNRKRRRKRIGSLKKPS